jgi:hypothetical protein
VEEVAQLPALHHRLAEFGRKKTRTILQGAMDEEFIRRGWAIHYVVSPDLANKVQEVNVRTDTMGQTLELGIHHFIFEPPRSGGVGTHDPSAQYDLFMDGAGAPALNILMQIMEGKKVHLVKNELELLTTQQILVCFHSVWLGVNHPETVNQSNLGQALTMRLL